MHLVPGISYSVCDMFVCYHLQIPDDGQTNDMVKGGGERSSTDVGQEHNSTAGTVLRAHC